MQTYSLYSDENYKIFATLIDNNDLIERGVDTGGYDFRIVFGFEKNRLN